MKTNNENLIEFKDYKLLTEQEFHTKLIQSLDTILVRVSFPNQVINPFYIELLRKYTLGSTFVETVNADTIAIINFHTANQFDSKRINIFYKTNYETK